jgi:HNH endonuclease
MSDAIKALVKAQKAKLADFPDYTFLADGSVYSCLTGKILRPIRMGEYVGLQLRSYGGGFKKRYLHRLIAEAFHGPCPDRHQCRHLDGDRSNNAAANLAWGTPKENNADKAAHGTAAYGEKNPMAALSAGAVLAMRRRREKTGDSYAAIARAYGVSTMTAYRAITGQSWRVVK